MGQAAKIEAFQESATTSWKPCIFGQKLSKWKRFFPLKVTLSLRIRRQWSDILEEELYIEQSGNKSSQSEV
jgi:hypothetical protein